MHDITNEGRELIKEYYNSDYRVRTVSVRLLELHALYADLFADALIEKAQGHDDAADALVEKMKTEVGKYELAFERWFDHGLLCYTLGRIFKGRTVIGEADILSV